jgi:excisionase family DNA binding protein
LSAKIADNSFSLFVSFILNVLKLAKPFNTRDHLMRISNKGRARTFAPSEEDISLAKADSHKMESLESAIKGSDRLVTRFSLPSGESIEISLPAGALTLFLATIKEMAKGHAVGIVPLEEELATQEAADFLHVSRPFLVKLLDDKRIPSRKVGTKRRVRFDDLLRYKAKEDEERKKILDQLTAEAQEMGDDY